MQHVHFTDQQIRILALAALIEVLPEDRFNMECWLDDNFGPSCIAGWACWESLGQMDSEAKRQHLRHAQIPEIAGRYLGVYGTRLCKLFTPQWQDLEDEEPIFSSYSRSSLWARTHVTTKWAAATLRRLALTGEVDWKAARCDAERPPISLLHLPELIP
ncbi:hypothetical protein [Sinorhizobium fredii]|uniref:hypothetical protein n=1 Tax=Rhizobium fredii TaxID=380 RepID=UPI0004B6C59A|nr:hypothetical protein [Sinorhizobium fredii]